MSAHRVYHAPAFVLHSIDWRETSLIIDLFCQTQGRITAVAKGAKRKGSALRPVLQQFVPLTVSFSGKSEVKTLTDAEWVGGFVPLSGDALMCGFYLNELLLRFLAQADPHPHLFTAYQQALLGLNDSSTTAETEIVLRQFEWALLQEIGLAPSPFFDSEQRAIEPQSRYECWAEKGFTRLFSQSNFEDGLHGAPVVSGSLIAQLAEGRLEDSAAHRHEAKRLMRYLFRHYLAGKTLKTREMMIRLAHLF